MTRYAGMTTENLRSLLQRQMQELRRIERDRYSRTRYMDANRCHERIDLIEAELRAREGQYPLWRA